MSPEVVAEVCHEANRALTRHTHDVPVQPVWDEAPDEMRTSCIAGVKFLLAHPDAPTSASHEAWRQGKLAEGWTLGAVKDAERKTHPALVPYEDLAPGVRAKDALFVAIVRALSSAG